MMMESGHLVDEVADVVQTQVIAHQARASIRNREEVPLYVQTEEDRPPVWMENLLVETGLAEPPGTDSRYVSEDSKNLWKGIKTGAVTLDAESKVRTSLHQAGLLAASILVVLACAWVSGQNIAAKADAAARTAAVVEETVDQGFTEELPAFSTQTLVPGPRPWHGGLFTLSARLVDGAGAGRCRMPGAVSDQVLPVDGRRGWGSVDGGGRVPPASSSSVTPGHKLCVAPGHNSADPCGSSRTPMDASCRVRERSNAARTPTTRPVKIQGPLRQFPAICNNARAGSPQHVAQRTVKASPEGGVTQRVTIGAATVQRPAVVRSAGPRAQSSLSCRQTCIDRDRPQSRRRSGHRGRRCRGCGQYRDERRLPLVARAGLGAGAARGPGGPAQEAGRARGT